MKPLITDTRTMHKSPACPKLPALSSWGICMELCGGGQVCRDSAPHGLSALLQPLLQCHSPTCVLLSQAIGNIPPASSCTDQGWGTALVASGKPLATPPAILPVRTSSVSQGNSCGELSETWLLVFIW